MLANSLVAKAYLRRGLWLWLVARATITTVLLIAGADAWNLSASALTVVVLLIVALGWFETFRHRERALLGNLGVSPLLLSAFFAVPALLGETLLGIGATVFA